MLRIMIDWDFISPGLQTVSGIVIIHNHNILESTNFIELTKFRVTVKPGCVGYKSLDEKNGIPSTVLEAVKPQLDVMVRSYQQGVIMDKMDFTWIIEEDIVKGLNNLKSVIEQYSEEDDKYYELKTSNMKERK
jgi:hypothetical protein